MVASVAHRSLAAIKCCLHWRTLSQEVQEDNSSLPVKLAGYVIVGFLGPDCRETAAGGVVQAVFHVRSVLHAVLFSPAACRTKCLVSAGPLKAFDLLCRCDLLPALKPYRGSDTRVPAEGDSRHTRKKERNSLTVTPSASSGD